MVVGVGEGGGGVRGVRGGGREGGKEAGCGGRQECLWGWGGWIRTSKSALAGLPTQKGAEAIHHGGRGDGCSRGSTPGGGQLRLGLLLRGGTLHRVDRLPSASGQTLLYGGFFPLRAPALPHPARSTHQGTLRGGVVDCLLIHCIYLGTCEPLEMPGYVSSSFGRRLLLLVGLCLQPHPQI